MKFQKLVKIITESGFNPSSPKSMGGNRFYNAQKATGPGRESVSPVGRADNFETKKPLERWEYNPNEKGDLGAAVGSSMYGAMLASFGLLMNNDNFKSGFNKIAKEYGSNVRSYDNSKTIENFKGEQEKVAYDYEKKLDNLEFMKAKRAAQVTELQVRKRYFESRLYNWEKFQKSPLQKNRLKVMYVGLKASVEEIEKQNKKSKNNNFFEIREIYTKIDKVNENIQKLNHELSLTKSDKKVKDIQFSINRLTKDISRMTKTLNLKKYSKDLPEFKKYRKYVRKFNNIEEKYIASDLDISTINKEAKDILDLTSKIEDMQKSFQEVVDELEDNYTYIDQINELNGKSDANARVAFIHLVTSTAKQLIIDNKQSVNTLVSLDQLDWSKLPQNNAEKMQRLEALSSEDANINPLVGYLDAFQRSYDNREYKSSLQLDRNVNITSIRDFEMLPFSVMLRVSKSVITKPLALKEKEYDDSKSSVFDAIKDYLGAFKGAKGDDIVDGYLFKMENPTNTQFASSPELLGIKVSEFWKINQHKNHIKDLITQTGLPESFKTRHILWVSDPYKRFTTSRTGANSFIQLLSSLDADIRSTKPKTESFDKMFARLVSERVYHEDDFKLDTMEVLSYIRRGK